MKYLQKAVMPAREREWLAYGEEAVCGYVVQAEHAAWADTPEKLFRVHGLGFPGSPLSAELSFLDVIRIPVTPSLWRIRPDGTESLVAVLRKEGWVRAVVG